MPRTPFPATEIILPWMLRTGVALCFIGHGSYGIITKSAWLPYFAVVGISEPVAWQLMPWVGAMDIAIGFLAFIWPCRALFAWAAVWAVWTAMLRPLAGQGWSEFFERAGNYGVPLACLVALGLAGGWFARLPEAWPAPTSQSRHRLAWTLRLTTATLLLGHAGCALLLQKSGLAHHYAVFGAGDPVAIMFAVGWFEMALAVLVLVRPLPALLVFVGFWKLGTESLFLTSGAVAPFFEVVERGGSYIAPLALAWLTREVSTRPNPSFASTAQPV